MHGIEKLPGTPLPVARYRFKDEEGEHFFKRETEDPTSPDRGKLMLETSILYTINNPQDRLIYCKPVDIFNMVGLWIYMMRGSAALGEIEFYNPMARRFIDEETSVSTLRANWGERLFASGEMSRVIKLLRESPNTRRAYVPVFRDEDIGYESRNLPCLAGIQFAKKSPYHLEAYVTMRAQAAIGVFPYDLFLLTMLHEYTAMRSLHHLGAYHHFAPLIGIREGEIPQIIDIAKKPFPNRRDGMSMQDMTPLEDGQRALFLKCEQMIRQAYEPTKIDIMMGKLPEYWQSLLHVVIARRMLKNNDHSSYWKAHLIDADKAFPDAFISAAIEGVYYRLEHEVVV